MPTSINYKFSCKVTSKAQLCDAILHLWDDKGFTLQALTDLLSLNLTKKQISLVIDAALLNKVDST